ncbi:H-type small acid-soluble spore protein [Dethiobacter alkaliphilus]|uniref:H-type small acid-soluble spore protein n=1 Tax=Dethiobacter alkaliphilus TaxID=427926 RepID=UPI0022266F4F|nr:H-type small acid-soluble spore protein [Dethiobacter alkaliphilus]MCW3490725.1 H-type small acid-soluble spore protein [Dethiobacter alkaliphilus]
MEKDRVKEILDSPEKIEVKYLGEPVWIEGIKSNTANVTVMGTCKTMDVPFMSLEETGKME